MARKSAYSCGTLSSRPKRVSIVVAFHSKPSAEARRSFQSGDLLPYEDEIRSVERSELERRGG
jgi:hypothetical protein